MNLLTVKNTLTLFFLFTKKLMKLNKVFINTILVFVIISCSSLKSNQDSTMDNIVKKVPLGDPFIMLFENVYYAYGTHSENGIEVYTSDDLLKWKKENQLALHKDDSYGEKWFWAPEVYYVDGKFYMYYSAEERICVAISDSPLGPFKQVIQQPMLENEKAIDNSLFIDDDGIAYLFFDRFNDGLNIWVAELEDDLITIKKDRIYPCIHVSQTWEEVWPRVNEGAFVLKHNGIYYMTYSANSYESPFYGIGCAITTDIKSGWIKYSDNPLLQKPKNLVGVGHSAMFKDKKGDLRIVFHAHNNFNNIHPRHMYIGKAEFKKVAGVEKLFISQDYLIPEITE